MTRLSKPVVAVGLGYAPITRHDDPDPRDLANRAISEALADSGLDAQDIDGIFAFRFEEDLSAFEVASMLGLTDLAVHMDIMKSGPGGLGSALAATQAVASGACDLALAMRCMTRAAAHTGGVSDSPGPAGGPEQFLAPFGWGGWVLPSMGLRMRRRMAEYGTTAEDYGKIALAAREWSSLNDRAIFRSKLTMDDYLDSRMICDPLRLLDCDYPVNSATAVLITTEERAKDLRQVPVFIEAIAYGTGGQPEVPHWAFGDDLVFGGTRECAKRLWSRTSLEPSDVDVALLYDGFTHITVSWLEALGFCDIGSYQDWIGDGSRICPGGDFPMNTHGGQLGEGRLHGLQFLMEGISQLRGQCGIRQVPDAQVAVATCAHGPSAGAMLIRR